MSKISEYIIPILIFLVIWAGLIRKENVYEDFVKGAKEGFPTVLKVMPTLIGLMIAVGMLRASGFMDAMGNFLGKWTGKLGFPGELMPLTIVKIFSSSAATGLLVNLYQKHGVDSYIANVASIMMSSTETIFYTMSIYFMTAKVSKSRWTLKGALLATLGGTIASVLLAKSL